MSATKGRSSGEQSVARERPCKCCGGPATLIGAVDFNKNCADPPGARTVRAGVSVPYHRCAACGFLFTSAFDAFSHDEFRTHIYNADYASVDPDYAELRPTGNASLIAHLFSGVKDRISVLDYGGGNGRLERELRRAGFVDTRTYDPFVPESSHRPDRTFNLVLAFEVAEHAHRPLETFAEMAALLAPDGLLLFSTLVQTVQTTQQGLNWWYVAPRNGHVSMYTTDSLVHIGRKVGLNFGSASQNLHVMFREVPTFAKGLFGAPAVA
jgi:2-polyprenyl-6-hydroxyphenyl methylase/3-demethylubiquinone-9 3-methyltransferase